MMVEVAHEQTGIRGKDEASSNVGANAVRLSASLSALLSLSRTPCTDISTNTVSSASSKNHHPYHPFQGCHQHARPFNTYRHSCTSSTCGHLLSTLGAPALCDAPREHPGAFEEEPSHVPMKHEEDVYLSCHDIPPCYAMPRVSKPIRAPRPPVRAALPHACASPCSCAPALFPVDPISHFRIHACAPHLRPSASSIHPFLHAHVLALIFHCSLSPSHPYAARSFSPSRIYTVAVVHRTCALVPLPSRPYYCYTLTPSPCHLHLRACTCTRILTPVTRVLHSCPHVSRQP
ncbi:hypothetical protein EVG20_g6009, partial [Dentipellis fragilis]